MLGWRNWSLGLGERKEGDGISLMDNAETLRKLHIPNAPTIVTEPPGPRAKELLERQKELESQAVVYPRSITTAWDEARGATIKDVDGNIYIDFFAGVGVLNVGHSNPYVLSALKAQLDRMVHALDIPTIPRSKLVEKLVSLAPGGLKERCKVFFGGPTGADANESAVKLARFNTKKHTIVAFEGGYHGMTDVALSLSSKSKFKKDLGPGSSGVFRVPFPYTYRCPFGPNCADCGSTCISFLEHLFEDPDSGLSDPAALIMEPIQGEAGVIVPPPGFLKQVEKICKKNGVLFIVDEIQTGFGRTGKMFASEHDGVTPDIMTISKGLGGIGLPISACIFRNDIDFEPGGHVGTFRGNLASCAAGYAALEYMETNGILEHSRKMGERMAGFLNDLMAESRHIGEVRGKGLMVGVEFVEDKESKKPAEELVKDIQVSCFKKGIVVWKGGHWSNVIRFLPPLVITPELIDKGLEIFSHVVKEREKRFK